MMDIPAVLAVLRPNSDWGPCAQSSSTYDQLAAGWRDKNTACPTLAEMTAAWNQIVAGQVAADLAARRSGALGLLSGKTPNGTMIRALFATILDDLNELRRAVTPPIAQTTLVQEAAKVMAKVNAGAGD